jgi:hypothetical protein
MKCPKCNFEQADQSIECAHCGIIFEKYRKYQEAKGSSLKTDANQEQKVSITYKDPFSVKDFILKSLFYVKEETNPILLGVRTLFFLIIFVWGIFFIITPLEKNLTGQSLWHLVNLPFHEFGHIAFRPFGRLITSLGGSLGQLLMPFICLLVFLIKTRDTFAASFTLWWLGENFMDLAPYINDARSLTMPLLGGNTGRTSPYGFHDWEFILNETGLLRYDHSLALFSHRLGSFLMILAFIWGGYILFKQLKNLAGGKESQ